jgi:hypothetical protein
MQLAKISCVPSPLCIPSRRGAPRFRPSEGTNVARGRSTCPFSNYHSRLRVISYCSHSYLLEISVPIAYRLAALGHARPCVSMVSWLQRVRAHGRVHGNSQLPDCMNLVSQHVLMAHSLRARKDIPMRFQKATCRWYAIFGNHPTLPHSCRKKVCQRDVRAYDQNATESCPA